ncbi:MAG: fibronectin type III domain-containing protein [Lachnospiraceae bacterium]|nr:fibronectin type III domain-containing protein [Lachnospiraceae bacterium]
MRLSKTKIAAVVLAAGMSVTGCGQMTSDIMINTDGSAKMTVTTDIKRSTFINLYGPMVGSFSGEKLSDADIDKAMLEDGKTKIVEIDGEKYYHSTDTSTHTNKEMNKEFSESGTGYITGSVFYISGNEVSSGVLSESNGMSEDMFKELGISESEFKDFKVQYSVEFKAPITNTNGKIDEANPNKVSFNLDYTSTNFELFATTESGTTINTVKNTVKKLNYVKPTKITKYKVAKTAKKAKKTSVKLTLKKVKGSKQYDVQYSTKKNMKKAKNITLLGKRTATIRKLSKGKTYYFRVRASKKNYADVTVYSDWSKVKKIKISKK